MLKVTPIVSAWDRDPFAFDVEASPSASGPHFSRVAFPGPCWGYSRACNLGVAHRRRARRRSFRRIFRGWRDIEVIFRDRKVPFFAPGDNGFMLLPPSCYGKLPGGSSRRSPVLLPQFVSWTRRQSKWLRCFPQAKAKQTMTKTPDYERCRLSIKPVVTRNDSFMRTDCWLNFLSFSTLSV